MTEVMAQAYRTDMEIIAWQTVSRSRMRAISNSGCIAPSWSYLVKVLDLLLTCEHCVFAFAKKHFYLNQYPVGS